MGRIRSSTYELQMDNSNDTGVGNVEKQLKYGLN